jgi:hypothetical protein
LAGAKLRAAAPKCRRSFVEIGYSPDGIGDVDGSRQDIEYFAEIAIARSQRPECQPGKRRLFGGIIICWNVICWDVGGGCASHDILPQAGLRISRNKHCDFDPRPQAEA